MTHFFFFFRLIQPFSSPGNEHRCFSHCLLDVPPGAPDAVSLHIYGYGMEMKSDPFESHAYKEALVCSSRLLRTSSRLLLLLANMTSQQTPCQLQVCEEQCLLLQIAAHTLSSDSPCASLGYCPLPIPTSPRDQALGDMTQRPLVSKASVYTQQCIQSTYTGRLCRIFSGDIVLCGCCV